MNGNSTSSEIAAADPFTVALDSMVDTWREQADETPVLLGVLADVAKEDA